MQVTRELRFRRPRDKWWLRKELTRYIFRPNAQVALSFSPTLNITITRWS